MTQKILVIGNGMVGHKFVELMTQRTHPYQIVVFGEESHIAYDRVNLSGYFAGKTFDELSLTTLDFYSAHNIQLHRGNPVIRIDRSRRVVIPANGVEVAYDKLVIATGSSPFVPSVPGREHDGVFVYRTLDDLSAIEAYAEKCRVGVVMGGGLLSLEAANALKHLELVTHVVELAPYLMPRQLDQLGGEMLRHRIEGLGIHVHTGMSTREITAEGGRVTGLSFEGGDNLPADMVVFSAGIRPRDELARESGIEIGPRGGIVIDENCRTSDEDIFAIGECALFENQIFGLVAPGYEMAGAVADQLCGVAEPRKFNGAEMSTKLKLLGVDVASFGDALGQTEGSRAITIMDACSEVYKKIVIDADHKRLLGGILIGDADSYGTLLQVMRSGLVLPPRPEDLIAPAHEGSTDLFGAASKRASARTFVPAPYSCRSTGAICSRLVRPPTT